jgi:hypothetical protein
MSDIHGRDGFGAIARRSGVCRACQGCQGCQGCKEKNILRMLRQPVRACQNSSAEKPAIPDIPDIPTPGCGAGWPGRRRGDRRSVTHPQPPHRRALSGYSGGYVRALELGPRSIAWSHAGTSRAGAWAACHLLHPITITSSRTHAMAPWRSRLAVRLAAARRHRAVQPITTSDRRAAEVPMQGYPPG